MLSSKNTLYLIFGMAILFAVLILFAEPYHISGNCMEPAVQDGKFYFLDRVSSYLNSYRIGDVILFNHEDKVWVSRIVALENNSIKINQGSIIINGNALQDSVQRDWTDWQYGTFGLDDSFLVPEKHVYVLSDNLSAHHDDSRIFGAIPHSEIIGRLW